MKTIKCSDTAPEGGCEASFSDETSEGMKGQLEAHAHEAHSDMMAQATPEDMQKWNDNFDQNVWPNAQES